ncbi:MAG: hypothetical protein GF311_23310 [Candidatus Lokiarchaeota archaeon]|nr:hypothetical protein [Candidatus Lokiarchaeota archaeon]
MDEIIYFFIEFFLKEKSEMFVIMLQINAFIKINIKMTIQCSIINKGELSAKRTIRIELVIISNKNVVEPTFIHKFVLLKILTSSLCSFLKIISKVSEILYFFIL